MRTLIVFLIVALVFSMPTFAQKPKLRMGYAQKPEEAKIELEQFKKSYSDLAGWENRKKKIREGILKGAKLSTLPKKTPLNPRFFKKRTYKGYKVENVAFESSPGGTRLR